MWICKQLVKRGAARTIGALLTGFLLHSLHAGAQSSPDEYSGFRATVPLVEAPFNTSYSAWPGMSQALDLSRTYYQFVHYGTGRHFADRGDTYHPVIRSLALVLVDMLAAYVPPGEVWLHEEFHRAVLSRHGIGSYNGAWDLDIGASTIAVYKVRDDDLIRLKRDHPEDMVRLPAAGIEGQSQLVLALEKDAFFDGVRNYHNILWLMSYLNTWFYISSGATDEADTMTDDMNRQEPREHQRDFVGHDFTSWVYDLHRPDEPYEERGPHPSGTGINRYRRKSDLTRSEQDYLAMQGQLALLSFVDPMLWGIEGFDGPQSWRWNASLQHYLTSFGYNVDTNIFLKDAERKWLLTWHQYANRDLRPWGISAEFLRMRLPRLSAVLPDTLSGKASWWRQPARQRFDDQTTRAGGAGGVTLHWRGSDPLGFYLGAEQKTAGWMAGNPWTSRVFSLRSGIELQMF